MKELKTLAGAWTKKKRPEPKVARSWPVDEWLVYLGGLPKKLPHDQLEWLDARFRFNESDNAEILCKWLVMAAASNYRPAFPKMKRFLGKVGRMKFLKPIYKALADSPETKPVAVQMFTEHAARYHPIARGGLEKQLKS